MTSWQQPSVGPGRLRRLWWRTLYRQKFLGGPHGIKRPICWIFGHDPYGFRMTPKHCCLVCEKPTPVEVMP